MTHGASCVLATALHSLILHAKDSMCLMPTLHSTLEPIRAAFSLRCFSPISTGYNPPSTAKNWGIIILLFLEYPPSQRYTTHFQAKHDPIIIINKSLLPWISLWYLSSTPCPLICQIPRAGFMSHSFQHPLTGPSTCLPPSRGSVNVYEVNKHSLCTWTCVKDTQGRQDDFSGPFASFTPFSIHPWWMAILLACFAAKHCVQGRGLILVKIKVIWESGRYSLLKT
jgi:hypothetical protein